MPSAARRPLKTCYRGGYQTKQGQLLMMQDLQPIDFRRHGRQLGEAMGNTLAELLVRYGDTLSKGFGEREMASIVAVLRGTVTDLRAAGARDEQWRPYIEAVLAAIRIKGEVRNDGCGGKRDRELSGHTPATGAGSTGLPPICYPRRP